MMQSLCAESNPVSKVDFLSVESAFKIESQSVDSDEHCWGLAVRVVT